MKTTKELLQDVFKLSLEIPNSNFSNHSLPGCVAVYAFVGDSSDYSYNYYCYYSTYPESLETMIEQLNNHINGQYKFIHADIKHDVITFSYGVEGDDTFTFPIEGLYEFVNEHGYNTQWISEDDYKIVPFEATQELLQEYFESMIMPLIKANA